MSKFRLNLVILILILLVFVHSSQIYKSTLVKSQTEDYNLEDTILLWIDYIEWPPICSKEDYKTRFDFNIHIQIINIGDTKYITTAHSNLLRYFMVVDLDGLYMRYEDASGFCMPLTHVIETGVTNISHTMSIIIYSFDNRMPQLFYLDK